MTGPNRLISRFPVLNWFNSSRRLLLGGWITVCLLCCGQPTVEVNLPGEDGLVREGRAWATRDGAGPLQPARASRAVESWLRRFRDHERRSLEALAAPCLENISHALAADPLMNATGVEACARAMMKHLNEGVKA